MDYENLGIGALVGLGVTGLVVGGIKAYESFQTFRKKRLVERMAKASAELPIQGLVAACPLVSSQLQQLIRELEAEVQKHADNLPVVR